MIIIDPVTLGDTALTRAYQGTYWDRDGVLRNAPADTMRVTYDPKDLSAAPYALVEAAATNGIPNNTMQGAVVGGAIPILWTIGTSGAGVTRTVSGLGTEDGIEYVDITFSGQASVRTYFWVNTIGSTVQAAAAGQKWCGSMFAKLSAGVRPPQLDVIISGRNSGGIAVEDSAAVSLPSADAPLRACRLSNELNIGNVNTAYVMQFVTVMFEAGQIANATIRIGLPQLERDTVTSPIRTAGVVVTRPADVVGSTAGVLYSNVPETEPLWVAGSYASGAKVRDAAHVVYESLVAANTAQLTDATKWLKLGATNRWAMLDDRNNTQTTNPEEIILVLSPKAISRGLYLGNLDAAEVRTSMVYSTRGVVHSEVSSLIVSSSGSSFFRWCFNRIRRRSYFLSLKFPVFASPLVTVTIRKPGGVAKCGMCMLGPVVDVGLAHYGLATELKDFSSTTFNPDGTSSTVLRGYAKRMTVDVSVLSEMVDSVEEQLINYRQKNVVWVGATMYGSAMLCGKYSSFKKVIESHPFSKMALQIEGVVS